MIKVHVQYVPSAVVDDGKHLRPPKIINLKLLDRNSPVRSVLESDEIYRWAREMTTIDFAHGTLIGQQPAPYRKTFKRDTDQYVFWMWRGTTPQPARANMYKNGDEPAAAEEIWVRLEKNDRQQKATSLPRRLA